LGSDKEYYEIFKNTDIYFLKTTTLLSIFFKPCPIARPITSTDRSRGV